MKARTLIRLLAVYVLVLAALCGAAHRVASLTPSHATITSVWERGVLRARAVAVEGAPPTGDLSAIGASTSVREIVTGEGPIVTQPNLAFAVSLVPGHDGVVATLGGRTVYLTPDDLLARQAYDHAATLPGLELTVGVNAELVWKLLADALHATPLDVMNHASVRRFRVAPRALPAPRDANELTPALADAAVERAAWYLARSIGPNGRFRYMVDAPTNHDLQGYDWPRHGGATYFLAQAAARIRDPLLTSAAIRAATLLRTQATQECGDAPCIGNAADERAEVVSSALALVAYAELVRTGLDVSFTNDVKGLARFLRQQQRRDGEMMHLYDRVARAPVDVQYIYVSGEAGLALSRAHRVTGNAADLDAASRVLAHIVGPAWHFFGSRYYFGEEHWTCQLVEDLWGRAPNLAALDFCERWSAYNRKMQFVTGETVVDSDGAYGGSAVVTPRYTPAASRSEAAAATLAVARRAGRSVDALATLEAQLRRSLALLVREQFRPDDPRAHLLAEPRAIEGAIPGSEVDWQLRIDYVQHAGSALVRWLELNEPAR